MVDAKKVTGIILSGGKSSRMGRDKGLCLLNGKPLIGYVIEIIRPFCNTLIISANNNAYHHFGYPVVPDLISEAGPAGGIYSGLSASTTEQNLVISCDMPRITGELIATILDASHTFDAVIPVFNGYPEPLCAFYNRRLIPFFIKSIQQKTFKLQEIIKGIHANMIDIRPGNSIYRSDLFANLNSNPEILAMEEKMKKDPDHEQGNLR